MEALENLNLSAEENTRTDQLNEELNPYSEAANTLVTMFKLCTFDLAQFILQEVEGDVEMAIEIFLEYYGFYELFAAEICLLYRRQLSR
jgi:hypothetical protein